MTDIAKLKDELTIDPLGRGYTAMTAEDAADSLNEENRSIPRESMTGSEVMNAIDKAEFDALTDTQRRTVWDVVHLGEVDPFGIEADIFISIFGGGSTTIATLSSLRNRTVSRAVELGIGVVRPGHVEEARRA